MQIAPSLLLLFCAATMLASPAVGAAVTVVLGAGTPVQPIRPGHGERRGAQSRGEGAHYA